MSNTDPGTPPKPHEATTQEQSPAPDLPFRQIGPYRLLEKIGEGGMGEVYLAEQVTPVRRRVALKLIKAGMDTAQVVARFESERQALALMNHPCIARVFDAGATEQGRPFFAMEHVAGEPITDYCDRSRADLRQRLDLILQVCEGVQHAHQKGIIHRDLKPGNILVSLVGGKPACKIIDFGVAKATQQPLTDAPFSTRIGTLIGTPEYMSPEQAELTGLDVDTRTDVYSLGIILYELLVGALPFDRDPARSSSDEEIRRRLREDDPPLPSTRLTSLGPGATESARRRGMEPLALKRHLRGDLDWITHKALEKDRTRRYGSPRELAADIQRHLDDEPVLAGPPNATYKMGKFVRRHRLGVAAAMAIAAALVAGLGLALYGLVRARRAEVSARQNAALAEQVKEFAVGLFKISEPNESKGTTVTARELLDNGAQSIRTALSDQPQVQARMMQVIGISYEGLGLNAEAEPLLQKAYETQRNAAGPKDPGTLDLMVDLARVRGYAGHNAEAEALLREAVQTLRETRGPDAPETLDVTRQLGAALHDAGKLKEAEPMMREALAGLERTLPPDDGALLFAMRSFASLLLDLNKIDEAEPLYRKALAGMQRKYGEDDTRTITTLNDLGTLLYTAGKTRETEPLFRDVLDRYRRLLGPDHPMTLSAANNLGVVLSEVGKLDETEALYRDVLERRRRILGNDHPETLYSIHNMGGLMQDLGRLEESAQYNREALDGRMRVLGPKHPDTLESEVDLCAALNQLKQHQESTVRLCRDAYEGTRGLLGADHPDTLTAQVSLGILLMSTGHPAESEPLLRTALEKFQKTMPAGDRRLTGALGAFGECLALQGKFTEAEPILTDVATQLLARKARPVPTERDYIEMLASVCEKQGHKDDAARWRAKLAEKLASPDSARKPG